MADINLNIGGNTSQLMRDIEKTVNRVYNINLKTKGEAPLGRITGKVNEFSKSLDASNARVIAFGASAGIIFGVQRAFSELAKATVEVQKSLQDINVILNVSSSQLQKFGGELFNIAKNTGQSFSAVAEAATEFSRQGLGVVETLKRTSEALILSRLSGLDTVKSVEALTAAVNSFASQAVTATEIVNKFANVDAAFAVSSKDLAEAIARVGSSAAQSGVSLNELIAIVTSAQQTTARGGAVIGNSFKTIFTRLQRGKVVDLLGTLGISDTNAGGELKSTIQLLQDLGKVYDTLGARQQAAVAEQVGGVFQINILKAALADLGKEYSIYNSALDVAAGSTDQAIKRNEELNKTYAAQLNALQENARQAGATVGGRVLGPAFDRVVGNANELLGGLNESDGQGVGSVLGKGILDGLGQVLAGPGLVLIGGVLFKLFKDLAGFAAQSFQQLLGLNGAATQQKDLQQSINQILQKKPQLLELALKGEQGIANAAALLLQNLRSQTAELQKQATVSAQIAKTFYASGVRLSGGVPVAPISKTPKVKSGGFIPNFFAQSELAGIKKSPDYTSSQKRKAAGDIRYDSNFPGLGPTVFNGQESVVASEQVATAMGYPAGTKPKNPAEKYSILTPAMVESLGMAAKGFIPNFAPPAKKAPKEKLNKKAIQQEINKLSPTIGYLVPAISTTGPNKGGAIGPKNKDGFTIPGRLANAPNVPGQAKKTDPLEKKVEDYVVRAASEYTAQLQPLGLKASEQKIRRNFNIYPGAAGALKGAVGSAFEVGIASALDYEAASRDRRFGDFDVRGGEISKVQKLFGVQGITLADFKATTSRDAVDSFNDKVIKEAIAKAKNLTFSKEDESQQAKKIATARVRERIRGLYGDKAVDKYFTEDGEPRRNLIKYSTGGNFEKSLTGQLEKLIQKDREIVKSRRLTRAQGFIPNFAAIQVPLEQAEKDSKKRELNAGAPPSQIRSGTSPKLKAPWNPEGRGTWSKKFESSLSEGIAMAEDAGFDPRTKGMSSASGFVPNFAEAATPTQDVAGALGLQLASILPLLALTAQRGDEYAQSLQNITEENKKAGRVTNQYAKEQQKAIVQQRKSGTLTKERARTQFDKRDAFAPTTGQKIGARFGGGGSAAFAAATIAPILAETLKQGVDQTTKEGRRNAALTSGAGQTAAFAATGFAIGGPVGAAVGAIAGAGLTLKSVLDEINTDLPELSAAAKKSSEALTKFNDQSQKILTGAEQVKQLREGGQPVRAAEIETQLLRDISVDFVESPDLALKATTAILNKDFKSLTEALNANTQILIKQDQERSREESVAGNVETLGKKGAESKAGQEAAKALGLDFFRRVDVTQGPVETGGIENLIKDLQKFGGGQGQLEQNLRAQGVSNPELVAGEVGDALRRAEAERAFAAQQSIALGGQPAPTPPSLFSVSKEDLIESIRASGLDEASQEVLEKLIKEQDSVEGAIAALEEFKKNIENGNSIQESIANNTSKNNKVIQLIQAALSKVASNFNKLAGLSSETLAIQSVFNQAKQEALSAIQVEDLSGRAEVAEAFGGQEQSRRLGIEAERAGISGTFDKEVGTALANVTDLIGQSLNQGISQGFKEIGSFGTGSEEDKAKQQLAEAQRLSGAVSPESILQEVAGILNADQFKQGTGVLDTNAITEALQQSQNFAKLSPEDQTKTLEQVRQEISKSNQVLQKSLVLQQQQLTILANQKLNQIIKELASAVINSFGGIEKFITGKALDDTSADDIKEILAERESMRNASRGEIPGRDSITEYGRRAGRLLDAFTEVTGGRGGIFTEDTGLVQQEIRGQANNIEDIFNAIRDASMDPNASKSEQEAFEKTRQALIEQSGVQVGPGGDMRPVFEEIARIQSLERRKSGEISTGIRENAAKKLAEIDPDLRKLLEFDEKGNLISGGALDSADLSLTLESKQVDLLTEIKNILSKTESEVPKAEFDQRAGELQTLEDAIVAPAAQAGIQLPGTEGITDALYNNIPMLGDFDTPFAFGPTDFTSLTDRNASAQALDGGPGVPSWVEAAQGNLTDENYYVPLVAAGASVEDLFGDGTDRSFLNKPSLNYDSFQSPSEIMSTRKYNNVPVPPIYGTEDIQTRLDLQNTPGNFGVDPTSENYEEFSDLRDRSVQLGSAFDTLSSSVNTFLENLNRNNAEAGSNQNLAGGTFGDITVSPAAINVTVEGSLEQDKIAEIERVLREQSDQNITQVIADLQASVSRQQETLNNITAQNPGVRPPPRGPVGAR